MVALSGCQSSKHQREWLISDDLGSKVDVELSVITSILERCNIRFSVIPAKQWPPQDREFCAIKSEPPVDLFSHDADVVWKNAVCQVLIVNEKGRYHLLIKPTQEISFEQISDEDLVCLKQKIDLIPTVFKTVFGFPDFCEQLLESKTTFGFELFPATTGNSEEIDLVDKDKRNLYLLSRGRLRSFSLPPEQIECLKQELTTVFSRNEARPELQFCYKRSEVNLDKALKFRINTLLKVLSLETPFVLRAQPLSDQSPCSPTLQKARPNMTTRCLFCNVPKKELIYQAKNTQIIVNPLPYVGIKEENSKHVLIVPDHHVEDCIGLTKEEVLDERKTLLKLKTVWKKLYPDAQENFFAWRQQGIKVGQTGPHLHWQVLTAKANELFEYYVYMAKEALKKPALTFPLNEKLIEKLQSA